MGVGAAIVLYLIVVESPVRVRIRYPDRDRVQVPVGESLFRPVRDQDPASVAGEPVKASDRVAFHMMGDRVHRLSIIIRVGCVGIIFRVCRRGEGA